jgi:acetyl esterase
VLVSAALDPLRDDSRILLERLRAVGVQVDGCEEPNLPHGFWKYAPLSDAANNAATRMCDAFCAVLDSLTGTR